ncbi:hypothetical protein L6164_036580 [Bauhinia variegata]|uniref:Uncharacterized protein n=1 Tax=Bauhinia variegata TaxID=167791 RepID=A0ACB9KHE1_BAUVA|nr:hypothetical protein L6164_036580 [Bauhinia variegata]
MGFILPIKVFLISTMVLFTALGMKFCIPLITDFLSMNVLLVWSFFQLCLKPPYIYVVFNGIIITIAAYSRFHHHSVDDPKKEEPVPEPKLPVVPVYEFKTQPEIHSELVIAEPQVLPEQGEDTPVVEAKAIVVNGTVAVEEDEDGKEIEDRAVSSTWTQIKRMDSPEFPSEYLSRAERPLVSARFSHRKPLKASPEGVKALKVSKQKRQETLENTWKAMTEGRAMPLSRHMKKCDTWENRGSTDPLETNSVNKSENFKDRTNQPASTMAASSPLKLRKEPSPSQDELNRRVEAFIRKFNEEMRLQRQQSLNRYMEM